MGSFALKQYVVSVVLEDAQDDVEQEFYLGFSRPATSQLAQS